MRHKTKRVGKDVYCSVCNERLGKVNGMGPQVNSESGFFRKALTSVQNFFCKIIPFASFAYDASCKHDEDYMAGEDEQDRLIADIKWYLALNAKNKKTWLKVIKAKRYVQARAGYKLLRRCGDSSFNFNNGCKG